MRLDALATRRALAVQAVATAAVSLAVLAMVGVPASVLAIQAAAFVVGGLLAICLAWEGTAPGSRTAVWVMWLAALLVLTTLSGPNLEGVRRWIQLGPLVLQPAPLVLPFVAWALTMKPAGWPIGGLTMGFLAQPDPSALAAVAAVVAIIAVMYRRAKILEIGALSLALVGLIWLTFQPDVLTPVAHVEGIVAAAWGVHPAAGGMALIALMLVPAPFILRALAPAGEGEARRALTVALSGLWLVLVLANLTGRFPAPVVGYGSSFVVGWLVSLGLIAGRGAAPVGAWRVEKRGARSAT